MERTMKKITMVLSVCMCMVLGSLSPAFAAYYLNQITNNQYDDITPVISQNGDIAWVGFGELSADIFVYDAKTKVTSQLMNDGVEDNNPRINDVGDIVWRKLNLDELDYNIMMYRKATGQILRISLPYNPLYSHNDNNPQINNLGQVVYESAPDGLDPEIMLYTGATVTQITNNALFDTNPTFNYNGEILWTASADGVNSDVWLSTNGTSTQISTTAMQPCLGPRMNNIGDIVWSGWDTVTLYYQIYYYKRSTKATTKLTSSAFDNTSPQINLSGQLTWIQGATNDGDIFFRSGLTGTNINITNTSGRDDSDAVINDGGCVTYSQDQGTTHTNDQIFIWCAGTTTRLITDTYTHINPQINNSNTVVWQGTGGAGTPVTDWEIFTATTGTCPLGNSPCNDNNACTLDYCDLTDGVCKHNAVICAPILCMAATCNTVTGCVYLPMDCNDGNACTIDNCNAITGTCTYTPNPCNDFNACTIDTCVAPFTGCVHTPIAGIDDGNACTDNTCNPVTGVITFPVKNCNDNNICTTDSCNTATGCVNAPKCNDNNLCTIDNCNTATGACTNTPVNCDDKKSCTDDSCNTATGLCVNTINGARCPLTYNNQFTMLDPGGGLAGGTNDVVWAWDGTLKTAVSTSNQIANVILYSTCQYNGVSWSSHDVAIYGPGAYTVYAGCPAGSPGCGLGTAMTFTVQAGEMGAHMLFNWNDNNDIDVVNISKPNAVFAPSRMWTSGPGSCSTNAGCTVWGWMSYDWDGDGNNGGRMVDGPFVGFSPNFSYIPGAVNPCCDAATRCNDNSACTVDTCNTATGACTNTPIVCNDNNVCTTDTCDSATGCVYTVKACNDNNPCTTDSCNTTTGLCSNVAIVCQDNNACTTDFCNTATGLCAHTPIFCADGNACTTDVCNTATGCVFTPRVCNDNKICTTDACNTATGCVFTNNTLACSDNSYCTVNDICANGVCVPGAPKVCNDNNLCTTDTCVPVLPSPCVFTPNTLSCNDNNGCTVSDVCANKVCTGTPKNCDDNNSCTIDSCNTATSNCVRTLSSSCPASCAGQLNGTACTDNNACTLNDTCQNGICVGATVRICNDNNQCTSDICDPSNGCVFTNNNTLPCFDSNSCTDGDYCFNGVCNSGVLRSCDDNNPCTDDKYIPVIAQCCVRAPNTKTCNDNNACTTSDVCKNSVCAGTAKNCNDYNACTTNTCEPATGNCIYTQAPTCYSCTGKPDGTACSDNNACTVDVCTNQVCVSTTPQVCNDNNPCTTDTCNTATGCVFTNNTLSCNDSNYCTAGDTCANGVCVPGPLMSCDDGNVCTSDVMAPFLPGCCTYGVNALLCNDGNACTIGDVCANRACVPGTPITCSTGLTCNPATGVCQ